MKHEFKIQHEFFFNIVVEFFSFAEDVENHSHDVASINITIHQTILNFVIFRYSCFLVGFQLIHVNLVALEI